MTPKEKLVLMFDEAFKAVAPECVEIARDILSVPVQYVQGPLGGTIVIRSNSGESPRKEFGDLQNDTQSKVVVEEGVPTLSIFWTLDYAKYLDDGDGLNRPILAPLMEKLETFLPGALAAAMR